VGDLNISAIRGRRPTDPVQQAAAVAVSSTNETLANIILRAVHDVVAKSTGSVGTYSEVVDRIGPLY
jgi:hypothetical protein